MNKIYSFSISLMITFLCGCQIEQEPEPSPFAAKDWNFIVIVVDDLGYMDIEPNNKNSFYNTPNLNQFAQSSTNFTNSYAVNPVCSPTRLALMTGTHPSRVKATDWFHHAKQKPRTASFNPATSIHYMPLEMTTIAEAMPPRYQTNFVGKWHLGEDESYWPEHQGFDINIAGWSAGHPKGGFFSPFKNPRLSERKKGEYLTDRLTDEAINTIKTASDEPFLLMLNYYTVHVPLQAPQDTVVHYEQLQKPLTHNEEFSIDEQVWPNTQDKRLVRIAQNHPTYAAMVEHMDRNIGRVLQQIEQSGLAENTVVFITSDNGGLSTAEKLPTSNEPYRAGKGWIYEGGIKVPLLVRMPGTHKTQTINKSPVISMDIPATIYELADIPQTTKDGQSLLPYLTKDLNDTNRPLFWHYPHYSNQGGFPAAAVRLGNYKLIQRLESGEVHLYDLDNDIGEKRDLAQALPAVTDKLTKLLKQWYKQVDAEFLQEKQDKQPWHPE